MSGYTLPYSYVTVRRFWEERYCIIICFSLLYSNYSACVLVFFLCLFFVFVFLFSILRIPCFCIVLCDIIQRALDNIVTISFASILYCGCFNLFCYVWVCVCVSFVMCGCVLVICVLVHTVLGIVCTVFSVFFHLCIFILICFVCTSVRITATE